MVLSPNSIRPPEGVAVGEAPARAMSEVADSGGARLRDRAGSRWAVVGGGMLGMTIALRLAEAGRRVTLFEAADSLGGLAGAWQLGDVTWDRHYHVTLLSDAALRRLLAQLGLENEMHWAVTRTGFYSGGRLLSMSNTLEFLRFPPLNLLDKLRLGATILKASRVRDPVPLESVPVAEWLRRWSGARAFERVWLPLLRSKLGESYREISAAFIWATIARMYAARRSGLKQEMFGYVPGGYARIIKRLGDMLDEKGVSVRCGSAAKSVRAEAAVDGARPGRVSVGFADGSRETFHGAVVTLPAPAAARVCEDLSKDERERLGGIKYQGIVCASLLLRRPLADFYVTNITDAGLPFTGVIEMSALVRPEQFGGSALVYLPKYAAPDDPIFALTDEELKEQFLAGLARMYPSFDREDLLCFRVSRVRHVFPLPTLGYSARLPPIETTVPNLHVINSAHITNGTLNVNETVQLAESFAARLVAAGSTSPEI